MRRASTCLSLCLTLSRFCLAPARYASVILFYFIFILKCCFFFLFCVCVCVCVAQELQEKAAWAVGNLAGDSPEYRDRVCAAGALIPLINLVAGCTARPQAAQTAAWALANLCRGTGGVSLSECVAAGLLDKLRAVLGHMEGVSVEVERLT